MESGFTRQTAQVSQELVPAWQLSSSAASLPEQVLKDLVMDLGGQLGERLARELNFPGNNDVAQGLVQWSTRPGSTLFVLMEILRHLGRSDWVSKLKATMDEQRMQLFVHVREHGREDVHYTVSTLVDASLRRALEGTLGDLTPYRIVGPNIGIHWGSRAGELKGQQLSVEKGTLRVQYPNTMPPNIISGGQCSREQEMEPKHEIEPLKFPADSIGTNSDNNEGFSEIVHPGTDQKDSPSSYEAMSIPGELSLDDTGRKVPVGSTARQAVAVRPASLIHPRGSQTLPVNVPCPTPEDNAALACRLPNESILQGWQSLSPVLDNLPHSTILRASVSSTEVSELHNNFNHNNCHAKSDFTKDCSCVGVSTSAPPKEAKCESGNDIGAVETSPMDVDSVLAAALSYENFSNESMRDATHDSPLDEPQNMAVPDAQSGERGRGDSYVSHSQIHVLMGPLVNDGPPVRGHHPGAIQIAQDQAPPLTQDGPPKRYPGPSPHDSPSSKRQRSQNAYAPFPHVPPPNSPPPPLPPQQFPELPSPCIVSSTMEFPSAMPFSQPRSESSFRPTLKHMDTEHLDFVNVSSHTSHTYVNVLGNGKQSIYENLPRSTADSDLNLKFHHEKESDLSYHSPSEDQNLLGHTPPPSYPVSTASSTVGEGRHDTPQARYNNIPDPLPQSSLYPGDSNRGQPRSSPLTSSEDHYMPMAPPQAQGAVSLPPNSHRMAPWGGVGVARPSDLQAKSRGGNQRPTPPAHPPPDHLPVGPFRPGGGAVGGAMGRSRGRAIGGTVDGATGGAMGGAVGGARGPFQRPHNNAGNGSSSSPVSEEEHYLYIDPSNPDMARGAPSLEVQLAQIPGWSPHVNGSNILQIMQDYQSQDGNFVIWGSRRMNQYVITVSHQNNLVHYVIRELREPHQTHYFLYESGFRSTSLYQLVQHYIECGVRMPVAAAQGSKRYMDHVKLRRPLIVTVRAPQRR